MPLPPARTPTWPWGTWPACLQVQLILPEALKLLPLYSLALHKCPILRPDVRLDERSLWLANVVGASCGRIMGLLHPRLFAVHALLVGISLGAGSIAYAVVCVGMMVAMWPSYMEGCGQMRRKYGWH